MIGPAIEALPAEEQEASRVAHVTTCALWGLETALVEVEADVSNGLPNFNIVGLPDTAVSEARERVRSAIRNSGFDFPLRRIVVNLAPAERRKEGTGFDLAIALAILRASDQLLTDVDGLCLGELSLDGAIRPVRGVMPRVLRARDAAISRAYLPAENATEAAALGCEAIALRSLRAALDHLDGRVRLAPSLPPAAPPEPSWEVDLADIAGQETPKRALEIAAAGGHNLLFIGPPGTGKTMLARALPSILPPLDPDESLVASTIHSVAGLTDPDRPLLSARPFRAPHHTASRLALVGGGKPPRPGEVSLAHFGALFLDELPEFPVGVLETLREPLEEGSITISRAGASATYPARFTLVAAQNACRFCQWPQGPREPIDDLQARLLTRPGDARALDQGAQHRGTDLGGRVARALGERRQETTHRGGLAGGRSGGLALAAYPVGATLQRGSLLAQRRPLRRQDLRTEELAQCGVQQAALLGVDVALRGRDLEQLLVRTRLACAGVRGAVRDPAEDLVRAREEAHDIGPHARLGRGLDDARCRPRRVATAAIREHLAAAAPRVRRADEDVPALAGEDPAEQVVTLRMGALPAPVVG